MKKLHSQSGFGVVEILLVIAVVGLISGIGYYVYSNNKESNNAAQSTLNSTEGTDKANASESEKKDTVSGVIIESPKLGFTIEVPESWNHRSCGDIDAVAFLDAGGGGTKQCLFSDATWPEDDWYKHGRVVISTGENPYPRPGDLYDADAETLTLGNNSAKKFTYTFSPDKGASPEITVVEYVISGKVNRVTAKLFSSTAVDAYVPTLSYSEVSKQLESALGTLQVK